MVWTAVGWTMLHMAWVGAAIGLLGAAMRRLARRARPDARYALALACLAALAAAPVVIFTWVLKPARLTLPVPAQSSASSVAIERGVRPFPGPVRDRPDRSEKRVELVDPATTGSVPTSAAWLDVLAARLPWLWLAGTAWNLALLATGMVGVERLRRGSLAPATGSITRQCRVLAGSLGMARKVGVLVCDRIAAPILVGIVRPLILLPPAALSGWTVEQVEMVLLHELAHLQRWDNLVNLVQRLVETLLFFHPAAWWLSEWVRLERELCCDRLVVDRLGRPWAYAGMLAALAGSAHDGRRTAAALAMADRQVLIRIRRILDVEDRSMRLTMPEGLGLVGALLVGALLAIGLPAAPPKPVEASPRESTESMRLALQKPPSKSAATRSRDSLATGRIELIGSMDNRAEARWRSSSVSLGLNSSWAIAPRPWERSGERPIRSA
jgi:beta-lactamase regulating signal transducer with metallopeptidase domain